MTFTFKTKLHGFYRHISHLTGLPFYVGRAVQKVTKTGLKRYPRAYEHAKKKRTKDWHEIAKHGYDVEILMEDLTFAQVIEKEKEFVALYGRVVDGGILVNKKKGGDDGHEGVAHSEETKRLLSEQRAVPIEQKLKESVIYDAHGCWVWTGTVVDGRPMISVKNNTKQATRFLFSYFNDIKLKRNEHIHPTCGNPLCVNPSHHEVHIAGKAIRDKSALTEKDVRIIKKLAYEGTPHHEIAKQYGVARTVVTKITTGQNWAWVEVEGIPTTFNSDYRQKKKKRIYCLETDLVYESALDACLAIFGTDKFFRAIRGVCAKEHLRGYYKGYNFKFAEDGQGA